MQLSFRILDLAARLLMALGVGCLLLAGYLSWNTLSFARDTARTTGEVVSYIRNADGDAVKYRPYVRFRTADGSIITVSGQLSTSSERFALGTQVPVIYKLSKPTEARIALFTDNWLGACVALLVGAVGFAGGLLVRRQVRRELASFAGRAGPG
jgi:hypothetical protein